MDRITEIENAFRTLKTRYAEIYEANGDAVITAEQQEILHELGEIEAEYSALTGTDITQRLDL